jgi:hypothetical protein
MHTNWNQTMDRALSSCRTTAVRHLLLVAWLLCFSLLAAAETTSTIRFYPNTSLYSYRWKLLQLALDHTRPQQGPFRLQPHVGALSQSRSILLLENGDIDVLSLPTSAEREVTLRPIRIDILRGILGYRIFLIRKDEQPLFNHLNPQTLPQKITLGFNSQWTDLAILEDNGFKVVTSYNYDGLFAMLAAGRFDAFPRGINEVPGELSKFGALYPNLAAERSLAMFVDFPVYFWVQKNNVKLAARIEHGLRLALADGSFKALFQREHAAVIAQIAHEKRRVIHLHNASSLPGVTHSDTSWWWPQGAAGSHPR